MKWGAPSFITTSMVRLRKLEWFHFRLSSASTLMLGSQAAYCSGCVTFACIRLCASRSLWAGHAASLLIFQDDYWKTWQAEISLYNQSIYYAVAEERMFAWWFIESAPLVLICLDNIMSSRSDLAKCSALVGSAQLLGPCDMLRVRPGLHTRRVGGLTRRTVLMLLPDRLY